jgi:hypothetical protein
MRSGQPEAAGRELAVFKTRHPDFPSERVGWIPFADKAANAFLIENFEMARPHEPAVGQCLQTEDGRHL